MNFSLERIRLHSIEDATQSVTVICFPRHGSKGGRRGEKGRERRGEEGEERRKNGEERRKGDR